jgi:hypothetical protein
MSVPSNAQHRVLGVILSVTAVIVLFTVYRFSQRGTWLPEPPAQFGPWEATEMPLSRSAQQMLGDAPVAGRRYTNPFNERVEVHIIATASFDAYREPAMMHSSSGFSLTAEKRIPLFGKDNYVRAMVLKSGADSQRVLMYYWLQYRDGRTTTRGNLDDYRDAFPRLTIGATTLLDGQQTCIVRAYTQIHPADTKGIQARRNLNEVARALYASFKKDGSRP